MQPEVDSLKLTTKNTFCDIAKHAHMLAAGLQNAAPPQDGAPGKSVMYLAEIAKMLDEISRGMDESAQSFLRED